MLKRALLDVIYSWKAFSACDTVARSHLARLDVHEGKFKGNACTWASEAVGASRHLPDFRCHQTSTHVRHMSRRTLRTLASIPSRIWRPDWGTGISVWNLQFLNYENLCFANDTKPEEATASEPRSTQLLAWGALCFTKTKHDVPSHLLLNIGSTWPLCARMLSVSSSTRD